MVAKCGLIADDCNVGLLLFAQIILPPRAADVAAKVGLLTPSAEGPAVVRELHAKALKGGSDGPSHPSLPLSHPLSEPL